MLLLPCNMSFFKHLWDKKLDAKICDQYVQQIADPCKPINTIIDCTYNFSILDFISSSEIFAKIKEIYTELFQCIEYGIGFHLQTS